MRSRAFVVGAVLALAVVGVACGGSEEPPAPAAEEEEAQPVTLTASGFAFDPAELSAPAGSTIEYSNEDDVEHNFTAEDADLDVDVDGGGTATIDLADVEPGSYDFFCEYHKDNMTGTLEVTE